MTDLAELKALLGTMGRSAVPVDEPAVAQKQRGAVVGSVVRLIGVKAHERRRTERRKRLLGKVLFAALIPATAGIAFGAKLLFVPPPPAGSASALGEHGLLDATSHSVARSISPGRPVVVATRDDIAMNSSPGAAVAATPAAAAPNTALVASNAAEGRRHQPLQAPAAHAPRSTVPIAGETQTLSSGLATNDDLAAQNDLFTRAVAARKAGNDQGALALLHNLLSRYPHATMEHEARVEELRALQRSGSRSAAVAARRYLDRYPNGFAAEEASTILASE